MANNYFHKDILYWSKYFETNLIYVLNKIIFLVLKILLTYYVFIVKNMNCNYYVHDIKIT